MQLSLHPRGRLPLVTCTPVLVPSVSVLRNDSVYTLAHSRLDSLALAGNAPQVFGRVTRRGLPLVALVFNACFAALAYMTVSNSAGRVFNWFVNSEYSILPPYMTLDSIPINSDIRFGPTDVVRYLPDLPPLLQGFQAARFRPRHAPLPRTFPAVCGLVGHDHEFTHLLRAYIFPLSFPLSLIDEAADSSRAGPSSSGATGVQIPSSPTTCPSRCSRSSTWARGGSTARLWWSLKIWTSSRA